MSLNEEAAKKNVRITKVFPGSRLALLSLTTGETVGTYESVDEIKRAIKKLPKYTAPQDVPKQEVGWKETFEPKEALQRSCPNGYGPSCLCLDPMEDFIIFCPVTACQRKAACGGSCDEHFKHTKLFGDVTERALEATQKMMEEYLLLPGETEDTVLSTYDRAVANLKAGIQTHISLKALDMKRTGNSLTSLTQEQLGVISDLLGVTIRTVGSGKELVFAAFDKNGKVLGQHEDKDELLKLFVFSEEDE